MEERRKKGKNGKGKKKREINSPLHESSDVFSVSKFKIHSGVALSFHPQAYQEYQKHMSHNGMPIAWFLCAQALLEPSHRWSTHFFAGTHILSCSGTFQMVVVVSEELQTKLISAAPSGAQHRVVFVAVSRQPVLGEVDLRGLRADTTEKLSPPSWSSIPALPPPRGRLLKRQNAPHHWQALGPLQLLLSFECFWDIHKKGSLHHHKSKLMFPFCHPCAETS